MNARHTPGPWHVCDEHEASHRWVIAEPDGSSVADCRPVGPWVPDEEADANARLIANAPKLLAELENIANADPAKWHAEVRDQFREWAQSRARAVIAETTGAPPENDEEHPGEEVARQSMERAHGVIGS